MSTDLRFRNAVWSGILHEDLCSRSRRNNIAVRGELQIGPRMRIRPQDDQAFSAKAPLEPKSAVVISLVAITGGIPLVVAAHVLFFVPISAAFYWYAAAAYLTMGLSWSSLELHSRNAAIRGHNAFVCVALCLFLVLLVVQEDYEPFPMWATVLLVAVGIAGYSVMGICGFRNFLRWRRGDFNPKEEG